MTNRESQDREQSIARRAIRSLAPSPTIRIEADVENIFDRHIFEATGALRHTMSDLKTLLGKEEAFDLIVVNAEELKIV